MRSCWPFLAVSIALLTGCSGGSTFIDRQTASSVIPDIRQPQPPTQLIQIPVPGQPAVGPLAQLSNVAWFAANGSSVAGVGRVTVAGNVKFYPVETGSAHRTITGLVLGRDGNFWAIASDRPLTTSSAIIRMSPTGAFVEFPIIGTPEGIAIGPDSRIWFTDYSERPDRTFSSRIGAMDESGAVTYYSVPGDIRVRGIVDVIEVGNRPNEDYFTASSRLGGGTAGLYSIDRTGNIRLVLAADEGTSADAISTTNGIVWFTMIPDPRSGKASSIVRFVPGSASSTFPLRVLPQSLTGNQSKVWFTACATRDCSTDSWGVYLLDTDHGRVRHEFDSPDALGQILWNADRNLWTGDAMGYVDVFVRFLISVSPTSLSMTVGASQTVHASVSPPATLTAGSTDPQVATVTSIAPFVVTAIGTGHCAIRIHTRDSNYAQVDVTVK